jgi:hypothetical protein
VADPVAFSEPAHERAEERRAQPLEGKGPRNREVAPPELRGVLEMGHQQTNGESHGGTDDTDERGDRHNHPGVMKLPYATGEPRQWLGGHPPGESLQAQHHASPSRSPSCAGGVLGMSSAAGAVAYDDRADSPHRSPYQQRGS